MKQVYSQTRRMLHPYLKLFAFFILLSSLSSFNDYKHIGAPEVAKNFASNFDLNFAAAAPGSYSHITGLGGTWDNGDKDHVVESLEGGDFSCGEKVVFFTKIVVTDGGDDQTLDIDFSFGSVTTSGDGVGFGSIEPVAINDPDNANNGGDGNTAASITTAFTETNGELKGTVTITGLDQGETAILRIVAVLDCGSATTATGNIQASLESGGGAQTIPLKQAGQILETGCSLPSQADVCEGTTTTHTATAEVDAATYDWTLTGNATFVGGGTTKQTIAGAGVFSTSVNVVAGSAGSYNLSVIISKQGAVSQNCDVTVVVMENSAAPAVNPLCAGATAVSGTSTEDDGTIIEIFKGATSLGTTTVSNGVWSKTVSALAAGDVITAKATATGKCLSDASTSVTVADNSAAPTVNPLCAGATSVSGTSTEDDGTIIEIFKGATSLGTTTVTGGVWSKTVSALAAGDVITAKATATGECQSDASTSVTVQSVPAITVKNISNICPASTANLTTAVLTNPSGGTLSYYQSNCTTAISDPTAVGAGTYCIKVEKNGCSSTKTVIVTINSCTQGCTPGYWKNRKASWSTIKTTNDELNCVNTAAGTSLTGDLKNASFWTVFGLTSLTKIQKEERTGKNTENLTLLGATGLGDGSGYTQLARAATAALLNSCALTATNIYFGYPYSAANIIADTRTIFLVAPPTAQSRAAAIALARTYDIANNNVCTLDNSAKPSARLRTGIVEETITELSVTTFPNPYSNKVRFTIANPTSGQGSLEVFNMLGQKVKTVYQGHMPAGNQTYDLNVPGAQHSSLIYVLRVGDKRITGKLMQLKQ